MKINGKTALVLGAAKGIGKAIALALARAGANVAVTYYDWPEESQKMRQEFAELGSPHLAVKTDLRQPDQVENDIVINNIERGGMPVVHGPYTSEQWGLEMETTLKAKWLTFHHSLPLLKAAKEGVVVTLSSIAGIVGRSGPAGLIFNDGYAAANRAVSSFTETWAREAAPTVRVNEIMLGFFETRHAEQTRGWDLLTENQQQAIRNHTLLRRTGSIEEIVKAVFFLIEEATFMTGGVLRMDGGFVLGGEEVPAMPKGVLGDETGS
jgi:3-oxoacyl-[acyl-carrier protein] reductase